LAPVADLLARTLLSLPIQPELVRYQAEIFIALEAALHDMAEGPFSLANSGLVGAP
jgi:hypothetical protein